MLTWSNWYLRKQSGSCLKLLRATSGWLTPHKSVRGAQSQGQAEAGFTSAQLARHNNLSTALVLCQLPTKCVVLVPVGTALPTNLTDPDSVRIAHPPLRPSLPAPAEPLLLTSDRGRITWPSSAEMSKRILFPPHLLDLAFDVREAVHGRCGQFVFEA